MPASEPTIWLQGGPVPHSLSLLPVTQLFLYMKTVLWRTSTGGMDLEGGPGMGGMDLEPHCLVNPLISRGSREKPFNLQNATTTLRSGGSGVTRDLYT